eukprot:TRINITY_DN71_c0_g1_i1.p1 TRINITY_DN71_c0_g1~~TRINITY_DN71_c0_g1_i1.p1  ORF type:complete len:200 (+),score=70.33 TRINITY_DN71_c0_g1_i1:43-642(+)
MAAVKPRTGSVNNKCATCGKTVYAMEMIAVEDKVFHKAGCLKCTHCSKTLSPGNYASMGGVYYCKPHFKQLFALKGNYDEGFGGEKHAKKWAPQVNKFSGVEKVVADNKDGSKRASVDVSSNNGSVSPKPSDNVVEHNHATAEQEHHEEHHEEPAAEEPHAEEHHEEHHEEPAEEHHEEHHEEPAEEHHEEEKESQADE